MRALRVASLLAATALAAAPLQAQRPGEPVFPFSTDARYDASCVTPYRGRHEAIYRHIDANLDAHLANIQRWLRQPSISAQSVGITEMATLLRDDLKALGFQEAEIVGEGRVYLLGDKCGWDAVNARHSLGVLRRQCRYRRHAVDATGRKRFQVGLNARPAARIRAGDDQDASEEGGHGAG